MPKPTVPNPQISEMKFADHTVIVPPNRLKKKAVSRVGDSAEIAMDPIARAETALGQIKGEFRGWMSAECDSLESVRAMIRAGGASEDSIERLFNASHDIVGHAGVFGYPLAGKIADSLCRLISRSSEPVKIPAALIDAHVDSVRAVVREGVHEGDNRTGTEIYERLAKLTDAYLMKAGNIGGTPLPSIESPKL
jgi:hypothetical protein